MKHWLVFTTIILCGTPTVGFTQQLAANDPSLLNRPTQQRTTYYFDNTWHPVIAPTHDGFYRKVIAISNHGFTVQDFYQNSNRKQSNPFTFTRPTDLVDGLPKSINGPLTLWHENGQKNMEAYYINGNKQGMLTAWHSNGEKELEQHYSNGKENGYAVYWDAEGKKNLEIYFIAGHPKTVSFWENGNKVSERHYKKGKQEGITTYWDKKGNKYATETYQNDKLNGPYIKYYPNQKKHSEYIYKDNDVKQITIWHKNAQKAAYLTRTDNETTNCSIWDEQGTEVYNGSSNERCTLTIRNMLEE